MNRLKWLAALGAFAFVSAPVAAQNADSAQFTAAEAAQADEAISLGYKIYRYDQAAWHTTDALIEELGDPGQAGVRGWIINEVEGGLEAVFMRPVDDGFEAVWSGIYDGKKVRKRTRYTKGERPFTDAETALVLSSKIPLNEEMIRCSRSPFNTVVFPTGKPDGGIYVYFLVPQEETGVVPFGGHYRYEVVGGKIAASRKFTNSCISLGNEATERGQPSAVGISHSLDNAPTEIHVFSMYALKIPVAVIVTETEKIWLIEVRDGKPIMEILER